MRLPSLGPNSAAVVGLTGFYASLACAVMGIYAIDALSPSTFRIVMGLSAMLAAPTFLVAVRARSDGRAGLASVTLAVGSGIVLGALASWLVQHDVGQ
ncbi:MAG: hypothetical protein HOO96_02050, partial [Polyangiaceae bacterium]|nr:hypothetical protein [Polyangiaceae bacterium]